MRPHRLHRAIAATAALILAASAPASAACTSQGLDLMKNLNGLWRGKGTVQPIGGAPERISCRITYTSEATAVIRQIIECAGTDYKFEAASRVTCDGNTLIGSFEEKVAHNTGTVQGFIDGNNLKIDAESPNFQGHFNVKFKGETNHSVEITQLDPAKGHPVPVVALQLTR